MQIRFWMISALIKVVKSKQFCLQWTNEEKGAFKDVFLNWLSSNQVVLTENVFMKKLSLLFINLFESLAKTYENADDYSYG